MQTESQHLAWVTSKLRDQLVDSFNLEECHSLCFDLRVGYDELRGETLSAKMEALLIFLEHRNRLPELIECLQRIRPNINWTQFTLAEPEAKSPFKGLQYFTEADETIFFGREALTTELVTHLNQNRFLAAVGASGSGKSSVIRAGLVPALRQGAVMMEEHSSGNWHIHVITPGDEPLKALAASLTRDSESVMAMKTLLADLWAGEDSLDLYLYRQMSEDTNNHVLLVVDQFEELFTQCNNSEARRLFIENLVTTVTNGTHGHLNLIIVLRADFYTFAVQVESLRPLLETQQKIVGAMNQEELRQAIVGPTMLSGWQLQPGLVDTILQDVGHEPGALPLLSHALQETWERREGREMTLAGYQAAGGVRRAIAQTADTVFASMTPEQQTIARNIFLRLTEMGEGTEDTRRRATLDELIPQGETQTNVQAVVNLLARKRLVTLDEVRLEGDAAQNYAEVAHEALIREWPILREWLDEDREGLRIHKQITAVAKEWQATGEDTSYLYRGIRLMQAQEWATLYGSQLNELEQRFLRTSQTAVEGEEAERELHRQRELEQAHQLLQVKTKYAAEQERRVRVTKQALGVFLVLLILAISAAIYGFAQATIAERQSRLALAQSLSALSQIVYQDSYDKELATLLAIEAYNMNRANDGDVTWLEDSSLRPLLASRYFYPTLRGHKSWVESVTFSPDGQILASGSVDATIRLWDLKQPEVAPSVLGVQEFAVYSVTFSPDGQTLASGSVDATVRLWNLNQPEANPIILHGHKDTVYSVAFSPDGQTLASGSGDGTVRLWDLNQPEGDPIILHGHEDTVYSVAFSPDGQTLASGSGDATIRLWDLNRLEVNPTILNGHEKSVYSVVFNPDGQTLASGSEDATIRLWNINHLEDEPIVLAISESYVSSMAFSPDGQTLASGGIDATIRLWDLKQPELKPTVLLGHESGVMSVTFSPDGQTLASGSLDNTIHLWVLLDELLEIGCKQVRRNLTWDEWQRYLPGEPYRQTCPNLPVHDSVP